MNDIMIMGMPGLGFVGLLIIGLLAGLIAEKVTKSRHGLLTNLLLGVAGSYVGGYVAQVLGVRVFGFLGNLFFATIGAIILIYLWRLIQRRA